ncbi:MAG: peptidase T [Alistipes sp.]|nr:peptidase T [Alistipes sp.]
MKLIDRFLTYVAIDTQSDPASETYPSTAKQFNLLNHLVEEMKIMGLHDVDIDPNGYVTATLPATPGYENTPVIGFLAHVDTSPDMPGHDIKPRIIENYDGEDICLNENVTMSVADFPELGFYKGHTLITTDGTTLLGADDKAGIAEILTAVQFLLEHPEIAHGKIRIGFTPDEEIGRGVDFFNVEAFGAQFAYTVDGGFEGELEYKNFNAASAQIDIQGRNIHPGYAKDKMLNALLLVQEFNSMLPANQRPEHTEGYEGFYHLVSINGGVEKASMEYIIRDHDREKFEQKKRFITSVADYLNGKYGAGTIALTLKDQYYNMKEMVEPHPQIVEIARIAMTEAGVEPIIRPIRGGTDGSRLSYMGLPCPNLFTGGMNFHGKYEYISVDTMHKAVETIINIARLWAVK